jgi:biotin operon repressor
MMIDELRRRSVSWEAIGKALDISRQAAWERFS